MGAFCAPPSSHQRHRWHGWAWTIGLLMLATSRLVQASVHQPFSDDIGEETDTDEKLLDLLESVDGGGRKETLAATTGYTGFTIGNLSSTSSSSSSSSATFAAFAAPPLQPQLQKPRANNKKHHLRRGQRQRTNKNGVRLLAGGFPRPDAEGAALWPPIVNVAAKAAVTVNATCGQAGREEYCKLSDAQPQRSRAPQCGVCQHDSSNSSSSVDSDSNGDDLDKRHPIEHAIDGTARWWQSPSLAVGKEFEYVTITLDLKQLHQVVFILIKSAISPRPAAWILERSADGHNFQPWQYFGASDDDCRQRYGLAGQHGAYAFRSDDEVICSTKFAKLMPLENGEMQLSLLAGRPGLNHSAPALLEFTIARYVRLRFQAMHTARNSVQWPSDLSGLERRSFYTVRHIKIGARPMCSGHASKTRTIRVDGGGTDEISLRADEVQECVCQHNTCGLMCDRCCPMFNQRAYRQATASDVHPCERCQCHGHAAECYYNPEVDAKGLSMNVRGEMSGGGVCLNCTDLTTGINCERCVAGYYRPFDIDPAAGKPCRACDCNAAGTEGDCDPMGGQCRCREGFAGDRCDECAPGYKGEQCQKCACDVRGTMPGGECESFCQCKLHVEGERCDRCLPGFFALREDNAEGCTKCYCSGVATTCASSEQLEMTSIETLQEWRITDITRTVSAVAGRDNETGHLVFGMYEMPDVEAVYWSAPPVYLGNRLDSYGSTLQAHVGWVIVRGDTSGTHTTGPSVILFGENGAKIAYGDETYSRASRAHIRVTLSEDGWYHVPGAVRDITTPRQRRTEAYRGEAVTRAQFMQVLAAVRAVLVRGTFHTDQVESVFQSGVLWSGELVENARGQKLAIQVEQCECPHGYGGGSCERCEFGFARRMENTTAHERIGRCHECDCNGHAADCDVEADRCGACEHNTYGERCERCAVGFYGNAMRGTPGDCRRCACPLLADGNNFSPSCQLKELSLDMNQLSNELLQLSSGGVAAGAGGVGFAGNGSVAEYVCTQCPHGYTGDHCEVCDDGFYGSPTTLGAECLPCPCNGGPCDALTGRCISCVGNTEGWRCERCKAGYWGEAERGCEPCRCHEVGAPSNVCDSLSGQCVCIERFTGHHCDECDIGFGNASLGCPECGCCADGSMESFCDTETGQCACKMGVDGLQCDRCAENHFNFTADGCVECQCNPHGSIGRSCHHHTGQCRCLPNVTGRTCDQCAAGFRHQTQQRIDGSSSSSSQAAANGTAVAITAGSRGWCVECMCDPIGSRSNSVCNPHSGQCSCHTGVGGLTCDRCADDHYGFSDRGCKRCDQCPNSAFVCDDQTGRCICPPLSRGPDCQLCAPNAWGWAHRVGCQPCDCDPHGTFEPKCSLHSGECGCRPGFAGRRCDRCARGHYGYPRCAPCGCSEAGSVAAGNGLAVQCDDRGQCPCRALVTGRRCDQCRQSTYGLDARNPAGCLRCFCFGRSQECADSAMTWGQIRTYGARNFSVELVHDADEEYVVLMQMRGDRPEYSEVQIEERYDLQVIPGAVGNVSMGTRADFRRPMYFELPAQYAGDRLGSYGGWLNFSVWADGIDGRLNDAVLARYPLVQLHAHTALVLDYYGPQIADTSANVTYAVGINETFWRYRFSDQNVTRAIMLTALQNVKSLFVRATAWSRFSEVILSNVTMDSAYFVSGTTRSNLAHSVEVCRCPAQYDGTSCQDPGQGHYRWRKTEEQSGGERQLVDFVGESRQCECNGRTEECDRETGECLNCRDNSGGPACDRCSEGYYGDPNYEHGCQPCPCPETNRNFARGCTVHNRRVACICRDGYAGALCDRCAAGFFGQPVGLTGRCTACDCDEDGTVPSPIDACDQLTGQCVCRPGLTGRRCDRCDQSRSMLQSGVCRPCDNCTLTLLDRADELDEQLAEGASHIDPNGVPAPWQRVLEYENRTRLAEVAVGEAVVAAQYMRNFDGSIVDKMQLRAGHQAKRTFRLAQSAAGGRLQADNGLGNITTELARVQQLHGDISGTIDALNVYGMNTHHVHLPAAVHEAQQLLNMLRSRKSGAAADGATLQCARDQFDRWQHNDIMLSDQVAETESLRYNASLLQARIEDAATLAAETDLTVATARATHASNQRSFDMLLDHQELIRKLKEEVLAALNGSRVAQMDTLIEEYRDGAAKIRADIGTMQGLRDMLETAVAEDAQLVADMRANVVPAARAHSTALTRNADEYARLFVNSRNGAELALRASSAHATIVEAIEAAREAAAQAEEAVAKTHAELHEAGASDASIVARGAMSLRHSADIERAAAEEFRKLDDLNESLAGHKKDVEAITTTIWQTGLLNNDMSTRLNGLSNDATRKVVNDRADVAMKVSDQMRKVHREANDISADVYKLKMKLNALEPHWDTQLGGAQENVSQAQGNIIVANRTLTRLEDMQANNTAHFQRWNNSITDGMQQLRDQIAKARHAAEAIRISVQSSPHSTSSSGCIRSYIPRSLGLTTANTIRMSVAFNTAAASTSPGNSPLLFVQGAAAGTFIALELRNHRVHLLWNLGGNTATLRHPTELRPRDIKYNDAWYQIVVNRTMNTASLSVAQMDNQGVLRSTSVSTGHTHPDHTRLQLSAVDSRLWLGGVPQDIRPAELQHGAAALGIVVHQLHIDDEPVGLWNFAHSQGDCAGAMTGAYETTTSGSGTWNFNGKGYATVQKKSRPKSSMKTTMQLVFRTFDENALLFLAVDESTNRSVSLTLHRGRLIFRIDYGNAVKLEISTADRYNDGNWTKCEVTRVFAGGTESAMLKVPGREEPAPGSPTTPITSRMLPNLNKAVYYVGGVPPGFRSGTTKAPGADHPFLGCMRDIQVNGETYDPMESSAYFGVEAQCRTTVTQAGFHGSGWLQLAAPALRKRANFALVMRTLHPEQLVLLAVDATASPGSGNYSVSLASGRPHVWLQTAASQPVRLTANVTLNDGQWHVVAVQKYGCKLELRIDDVLQDSGRFDAHGCAVNVGGEQGRLFVGGAPDNWEKYPGVAASFDRFVGAVKDVVFNNATVPFNEQRGFQHVQLGRTGPAMGEDGAGSSDGGVGGNDGGGVVGTAMAPFSSHAAAASAAVVEQSALGRSFAAAPEGCHRVGSYSYEPNAFKFGDGPHSHAIVSLTTRNLWLKNFSVLFDFRTFYPNGVLFLAPGTKEKQKHFIGLALRDGQLQLTVRGRKRDQLTLPRRLNDGHWHSVSLVSVNKLLTVRVADSATTATAAATTKPPISSQLRLPKRLSAASTMFVGGLSETADGSLPVELVSKLEQFKGCIRRFRVNNATQDLVRPGRHFNVGQCFPSVEKGSYFPGDAYVIYKRNFQVGKYLELEFEFRTSELNGVLLSVSEPNGFPALSIELYGGKVVMSCDLGDGNPFRVETAPLPSRFSLCDNRWHNISAMYDSEQIALRIDQQPSVVVLAQRRDSGRQVHTKSPLYVGGVPDTAPSGTLLGRDNFKGCIRNVLIRNELRDWTDMDELHNVLLSECLAVH